MLDSDTDNSIVIEQNRHKKLTCLKDTPFKLDGKANKVNKATNKSMDYDDVNEDDSDEEDNESKSEDNQSESEDDQSESENNCSKTELNDSASDYNGAGSGNDSENINKPDNEATFGKKKKLRILNYSLDKVLDSAKATPHSSSREVSHDNDYYTKKSDNSNNNNDDKNDDNGDESNDNGDESDDGPDEDLMVMSRATRMSIMGVIPKGDDESDDSDFIQSDEVSFRGMVQILFDVDNI